MSKATILALAIAASLASVGISFAKEDKPGADWMPSDQVRQMLMSKGYTSVIKLEADDGHWEGEGMKNGVKVEFHVDPRTGAITKEQPDKD